MRARYYNAPPPLCLTPLRGRGWRRSRSWLRSSLNYDGRCLDPDAWNLRRDLGPQISRLLGVRIETINEKRIWYIHFMVESRGVTPPTPNGRDADTVTYPPVDRPAPAIYRCEACCAALRQSQDHPESTADELARHLGQLVRAPLRCRMTFAISPEVKSEPMRG